MIVQDGQPWSSIRHGRRARSLLPGRRVRSVLIRKNDKVTAINAAIEVDLTGQVCADSMGATIWSGAAQARCRRGDDAAPRPLGGDRVRRAQLARPDTA